MTLKEISEKIIKSSKTENEVDISFLSECFNFNFYGYIEQDRLKSYWFGNWCCTDSWVGYKMYFLDDVPVAYSEQDARKSDEIIYWFNEESYKLVKNYVKSLIEEQEIDNFNMVDISLNIGDFYTIEFSGNIIPYNIPMLNSEKITIMERIKNKPYGIDTELKISLNGEEKIVDVNDLQFGFYVQE